MAILSAQNAMGSEVWMPPAPWSARAPGAAVISERSLCLLVFINSPLNDASSPKLQSGAMGGNSAQGDIFRGGFYGGTGAAIPVGSQFARSLSVLAGVLKKLWTNVVFVHVLD